MAKINVLYFAWVRETIGCDEETLECSDPALTVADILQMLRGKSAGHVAAFADMSRLRAALDQVFVPLGTPIGTARELAIFPPVTGG